MKKIVYLFTFLAIALVGMAKNNSPLKEILYYGGIEINKPVICDSVNVRNEKFG